MTPPRAVVFGIAGTILTADEKAFLRDADPLGFILFGRNCEEPDAIRGLTAELRNTVGRDDAPVLIDQEGGPVMRLRPPIWHDAPAAQTLGNLYLDDPDRAINATRALGSMFGAELLELGIDVDCAPVADLARPETTDAIGTRAYSDNPQIVAVLARAMAEGLQQEGCLPVIKHIPGHGRAQVDSHQVLPHVSADREALQTTDFSVFTELCDLPLGMSAHVVFEAFDPDDPATTSRTVIEQLIRGHIGFDGFLFSDDIVMSALSGSPSERTRRVLEAGCDAVLHCSGELSEMIDVAAAAEPLTHASMLRWNKAQSARIQKSGYGAGHYADQLAELLTS